MPLFHVRRHAVVSEVSLVPEKQHCFLLVLDHVGIFDGESRDRDMFKLVGDTEQQIDDKTELFKDRHIDRLRNGECDATVGTLFMELLTNLERIADHSTNIAFSMYPKKHTGKEEAVQA